MSEGDDYTIGSGNVYADLGFEEPEAELFKAELAYQIATIIERRRWTQARAAKALGIDQPKVSALVRGRLAGFSAERLMRLLTRLDHDVQIVVVPNPDRRRGAGITVHSASGS
jgi:predicted XRE-type DNA-binding protein